MPTKKPNITTRRLTMLLNVGIKRVLSSILESGLLAVAEILLGGNHENCSVKFIVIRSIKFTRTLFGQIS